MNIEPVNATFQEVNDFAEKIAIKLDYPNTSLLDIIKGLGGSCHYLDEFGREEDSLIISKPGEFVIKTSVWLDYYRATVSVAHELGHYLLHYINKRGTGPLSFSRLGDNRVDWEANWFALAFLMPTKEFKEEFERYDGEEGLLSYRFQVNKSAIGLRAKILGMERKLGL